MIKRWTALLAGCLIGVPLAVYVVGRAVLGPYEGDGGFFGFAFTLYIDALTGHLAAWMLLFSPVLLLGIWLIVARLRRIMPAAQ